MRKLFSLAILGISLLCMNAQMQLNPVSSYMNKNMGTFFYDGFDGPVSNIYALPDGKYLCVGSFKNFDGQARRGVVRLLSMGRIDPAFNVGTGFNGPVHTAVVLPDGSYIIGGDFTHYGTTQVRKGFCKLNADGTLNTAFNSNLNGVNGVVYDGKLLRDGSVVLVGSFYFNQSVSAPNMLFLNTTTGANLNPIPQGSNVNVPGVTFLTTTSVIYSVDQDANGKIIVGGKFERNTGGAAWIGRMVRNFARFNEDYTLDSTYLVSGTNTFYNPINSNAKVIRKVKALADGTYIVAGNFNEWKATSAAATSVSGYVKINNTTGEIAPGFQLPSGAVSTASKEVLSFSLDNSNKFLFVYYDSTSNISGLIRTETDGSSAVDYPMYQAKEKIHSIVKTTDNKIAIAGNFKRFNQTKYTNNIAKFSDVNTFATVDSVFNHHLSVNIGSVNAIERNNDLKMYFGGDFGGFGATFTGNIVRLNADGSVDPSFNVVMPYKVYDIKTYGTDYIYVAHEKGVSCYKQDGTLQTDFAQGETDGAVRSLKILTPFGSDKRLVIGGEFTDYKDGSGWTGAGRLIVVDLVTGARNANYISNKISFNGPVYTVEAHEDQYSSVNDILFVGGQFTSFTKSGTTTYQYNIGAFSFSNNYNLRTTALGHRGGYLNVAMSAPSWINTIKLIQINGSMEIYIGGYFSKFQIAENNGVTNNIVGIAKAGMYNLNAYHTLPFQGAFNTNTDEVFAISKASNGNLLLGFKSENGYQNNPNYKHFVQVNEFGTVNTYFSNKYTTVADGPVKAIKSDMVNQAYLGGDFGKILDVNKKRIVKLDMILPAPANISPITRCQSMNNKISALMVLYPGTSWYLDASSPSPLPGTTDAVNGHTYYVTIQDGEQTSLRAPVVVNIVPEIKTQKVVAACSSYTWINGQTYTASTTAPYPTYKYYNGTTTTCDSVYELVLTINQPSTATVNHTACGSYTWPVNGATYTSSITTTHTIANGNYKGCDSTITLNLVIKTNTTASVNHTACYAYTWPVNGQTYTTSGTRTATIPNAAGCDSTITLNLVIGQRDVRTETEVACGSFTWAANNQVYTSTQKDTLFLQNVLGCDSLVVLDLTINQPSTATAPVSIAECNSYTWQGTTYTTSGSYTKILANAAGCDSVVTIDLTINNGPSRTETFEACDSYTWSYNNITYTTAGTHSASVEVPNGAGCDSVITLNLTIVATPSNAVTLANGVLTATASGATYQWYDCATNTAIAGATTQTYTPTALGKEYKVEVTNNDCSVMSNCVFVPNIGVKENEISVNVFPNPTQNFTQVVLNNIDLETTLSVIDVTGKVLSIHKNVMNTTTIDLSNYADGVYFIKIQSEEFINTVRVVKY